MIFDVNNVPVKPWHEPLMQYVLILHQGLFFATLAAPFLFLLIGTVVAGALLVVVTLLIRSVRKGSALSGSILVVVLLSESTALIWFSLGERYGDRSIMHLAVGAYGGLVALACIGVVCLTISRMRTR